MAIPPHSNAPVGSFRRNRVCRAAAGRSTCRQLRAGDSHVWHHGPGFRPSNTPGLAWPGLATSVPPGPPRWWRCSPDLTYEEAWATSEVSP